MLLICAILAAVGTGPAALSAAGVFRMGAARVEITPPGDAALTMAGYGRRDKHGLGFTKIHDSLFVRALVLDDGTGQAAIVSADVIGFGDAQWRRIAERIQREAAIVPERVLLAAVHTHGAPATQVPKGAEGKHQAWITALEDRIVLAVKQAQARLQPARAGFGTGRVNVNVNRRARMGDGWGLGVNPDGPSDKTVAVLRFDDLSGRPIAIFSNYGVHGVVMGLENREVTGDLPGATARFVEQQFGGDVVAPWTSGAAGDQNPIYATGTEFPRVATLGQILGEEVVRVAKSIATRPDIRIRTAQRVITCPGQKPAPGTSFANPQFIDAPPVDIRLSLMRLGPVALAGVSAEVLTPIQTRLKEKLGPAAVMVTHANGSSGYLPDDAAYEQASYEIMSTRAKRGCAEAGIVNGFAELMKR